MQEVVAAFNEADIVIAEVGAYGQSVLDPDPNVREEKVQRIIQQLIRAEKIGAICCVMHGGSVRPGRWGQHSPDNVTQAAFDENVKQIKRIMKAVEPKKTKLGVETESRVLPDSPGIYLDMIKAVDHPGFAAHLDPVNITLDPRRYYFSGDFIRECFEKLGPYIVSTHGKDTTMVRDSQVHFHESFAGNGDLDYITFLRELAMIENDAPLMIEHVNNKQMGWARSYILAQAEEAGVQILNGA